MKRIYKILFPAIFFAFVILPFSVKGQSDPNCQPSPYDQCMNQASNVAECAGLSAEPICGNEGGNGGTNPTPTVPPDCANHQDIPSCFNCALCYNGGGSDCVSQLSACTTQVSAGGGSGGTTPTPNPSNGDCPNGWELKAGTCLPSSPGSGIAAATSWQTLVKSVLDVMLTLSGVIAVVFIIIGGFWYMTSSGNEETAEKGKKTLINAIIGLVVVVLAFVIVQVLTNLLTGGGGGN